MLSSLHRLLPSTFLLFCFFRYIGCCQVHFCCFLFCFSEIVQLHVLNIQQLPTRYPSPIKPNVISHLVNIVRSIYGLISSIIFTIFFSCINNINSNAIAHNNGICIKKSRHKADTELISNSDWNI